MIKMQFISIARDLRHRQDSLGLERIITVKRSFDTFVNNEVIKRMT